MASKLLVSDFVWDGFRFTAQCNQGQLEGNGTLHQSKATTGNYIAGTIKHGPAAYIGQRVTITLKGETGLCSFA